jgi:hypothetical protein
VTEAERDAVRSWAASNGQTVTDACRLAIICAALDAGESAPFSAPTIPDAIDDRPTARARSPIARG